MDGSEYIDYNEFISALGSYDDMMSEHMIREAFDHFDIDNSGSLDVEELKKALNLVGNNEKHMKALKKLLDKFDTYYDGVISFEEFNNLILKIN